MFPWQDNAEDSQHNPVEGVQFRVLDADGNVVTLLANDGSSLGTSVSSASTGIFRFNLASAGSYVLQRRVASSYPYSYAYTFTVGGSNDASGVSFLASGTGAVARTVQAKARETVSVLDFGADPTGNNDSYAAIQAAFNSGAGKVVFPKGVYVCLSGLTIPDWLHIEGMGFEPGSPGPRAVELKFALVHGVALTLGFSPTIKGIAFNNTAALYNEGTMTLSGNDAAAILLSSNATIEECSFFQWYKCIETGAETYYLLTRRLQFNRCTYGYYGSGLSVLGDPSYDMHIDAPVSLLTNIFIAGVGSAFPRAIKVYGGSIEDYATVATHFTDIDFFGTYFETRRTGVTAITPGANGGSVGLYGCLIYLTGTNRFVDLGSRTGCGLTSVGNRLAGNGPAAGFYTYLPNGGSVLMGGDRWEGPHDNTFRYVDSIASASRFNGIHMPELPAGNDLYAYSLAAFTGQLVGSQTFDPASLADGAGVTTAVTVTGAALGDFAQASFSADLQGITLTAYVSSANTVSVRFQNESGGTIDLASGTIKARTVKT